MSALDICVHGAIDMPQSGSIFVRNTRTIDICVSANESGFLIYIYILNFQLSIFNLQVCFSCYPF